MVTGGVVGKFSLPALEIDFESISGCEERRTIVEGSLNSFKHSDVDINLVIVVLLADGEIVRALPDLVVTVCARSEISASTT